METRLFRAGKTQVEFYDHYAFYFLPEDAFKKITASIETPEGEIDAAVQCAFDYKRYKKKEWAIFIDISFSLIGHFDSYTRSCFYLTCDLEKLFVPEIIEPMMKEALKETAKTILSSCERNNIEFDESMIPFNEALRKNFANETIDIFNSLRLEQERKEKGSQVGEGLTIPADGVAHLVLSGTIIILDKVMFDNEAFDWKNNSEAFFEAVPIPSYITLRGECLSLDKEPIVLNLYSTTYLIICLDCALQLILGPHSEKLEKAIAGQGFTKEATGQYISDTGKILANLKTMFRTNQINISNLEKVYDWNAVLR